MKIQFTLNNKARSFDVAPGLSARKLLQDAGINSVRNSDDGWGNTGSDTIILDGYPVNAGLLIAAQLEGKVIKTVESLSSGRNLSAVQSALVDMGLVQSAYNSPAAALVLTDLLDRNPDPSKEEIQDALSGILHRDNGYQPYFQAVELAKKRMKDESFTGDIAPEFREDLRDVGTARRKVDGPMLARGEKAFVEDKKAADACVLKMLRSPHAHAWIKSIDTSEAEAMEGVEIVLTYKNTPEKPYTTAGQGFPEPSPYDKSMFNKKVRHVGDRVAAVVAVDEETALAAIGKIKVEYDVLQPIFSVDEAAAPGAPLVQGGPMEYVVGAPDDIDDLNKGTDPAEGTVVYQFPIGGNTRKNIAASVTGGIGDIDKGIAEADVVLEREYKTSQIQCTPAEMHTVHTYMDGDRLVIDASTQVPWHLRRIVSTLLGIRENKVHVKKARVGGGYGSKQDVLLEDVAAYATWVTGKPVFSQYTRQEEFESCSTRFPMTIGVKIGAKKDGTLTAVYMNVKANNGPFGNHCLTVPMNACSKSLPLFLCDNFKFDVTTYYTNIPPTGAYQGYGAPKGSYALQTAIAELAEELGMDHLELIQKNRVSEGVMLEILRCLGEGREGTPARVESCGLDDALDKGSKMIEWGKKEESDDPDWKIGKGVAIIQQGSGLPGLDQSNADIKMLADGTFMLHSGGADLGTGLDTVCVKMASEVLKVDMDLVSILSGDTDNTPFDTGAYASSGTYFSGNAAKKASEKLLDNILTVAAEMLEEPKEDLQPEYPGYIVGKKGKLTYREIAHHCESGEGDGPGQMVAHAHFVTDDAAFPYGAHFCQVAVNVKTGKVKLQKYYALQDIGTPINPEIALSQIYGGVLKSIGHTMWEEMVLDEKGKCLTTNFDTYHVPMIKDLPEDFKAELIFTEDPFGPYGGKSVSEISTNGAAPVIAAAIHDAVGVWMRSWPFSPEKVLKELGKI
ncbi:molybdopterin-dependent oxidoreductase Mo/Fe-S-binding subunit [Spirochaeta isovalerica]|uniref:Putative selenate reductase molybdopterin-binding subunit n=1 Tax=Spirochaeta isovalerica TaxID=150 RepID=A0A841R8Z2_9SPIO|nr:molybdopterin-dependent oxidoreductase Mo/Fe-S-binding subunit [Spirochaeta isovalerica]MBB6479500.1 putative selenate reductase molybdopterin-binding subunit [Spirochaeta isovalerica]